MNELQLQEDKETLSSELKQIKDKLQTKEIELKSAAEKLVFI
jgi:hypothetical protein